MADASQPADLNGILAQLFRFGPTDEEKKQAFAQALTRGGLGMLAANQPSRLPVNSAGVLAQGLGSGLDAYQGSLDRLQAERKANAGGALQGLQIKKTLDQQQALSDYLAKRAQGPQGAAAAGGTAPMPRFPEGGPWAPGAPTAPVPAPQPVAGGFQPHDPAELERLAAGGVNVDPFIKISEYGAPKLEFQKGIGGVDPRTGAVRAPMPTITDNGRAAGLVQDGKGGWRVQVPEGSMAAYQGFQNADEAARARFDPFLGQLDAQNRPIPQTRLQFAGGVDPIAAAAAGGAAPKTGMGFTPVQASAAREVGQSDAQRVSALEQKVPSLVSTLRRLDRMGQLTGDATYSAAGAEIKSNLGSIAQAFGLNVNKDKTANTEEYITHVAELLKERLASKDYGSGSGVSNLDLLTASKPLPELAKTEQGRLQIIQAIKSDTQRSLNDAMAAREHFGQNMSLRGFRYPSETERPPLPKEPGSPPAQTQRFNTLPPAQNFKDKMMRDTTTGELMKSDGLKWVPVRR